MKIIISLISIFLLSSMVQASHAENKSIQIKSENDSLVKRLNVKKDRTFYDTSEIFKEDWKVNITFSYSDKQYKVGERLFFTDSIRSYCFPVENSMTSGFGRRHGSYHKGIDIRLRTGQDVVAAFDGKVRYAKYNGGGFGNLVIIRHANGLETYYAHLSRFKVKPNQIVKAGQVIGLGGNTGRSYGSHLHFEVRYKDKAIDPELIFDTESYCLKMEDAMIGELFQKQDYIPSHKIDEHFLLAGKVYAIKPGDTLSKIAARNGTTVHDLCALNGLNQNTILQIGQRIRLN